MLGAVRTVVDPDGRRWRVGRVWFAGRTRWRGADLRKIDLSGFDLADLLAEVPGVGLAIALVVVGAAVALLLVTFVLPAVALLVELAVIALIAALGLLGRVVLRRPWLIRASEVGGEREIVRRVVGFRDSSEAVEALAEQIQRGQRTVTWGPAGPA